MDRKKHDRRKAVLLAGRALSRLDADPKGAREDATHALKLAPDLAPAATIAAKAYIREDNVRKALSVLEQSFKHAPHPEVAAAYVIAGGGSAQEKLKRAERLENLQPRSYETLYAVAAAALDARNFPLARAKAEAAAKIEERESIYLLMADIEEAETGDQGRVRHWLAQALRAPRDPEWVADGQVSELWLPISPVTGRLDAFEWKRAYAPAGTSIDGDGNHADEAFRLLPASEVPGDPAAAPAQAREIPADEPRTAADDITVTVVPEPKPADSAEERKPAAAAKANGTDKRVLEMQEAVPFHGRLPDDPGVKARPVEKSTFRLF